MTTEAPIHVMITGSGGREDALARQLRRSASIGDIFIAPGNGGTDRFPDTKAIPLNPKNSAAVAQAAKDLRIGLVIIGPEDPLIGGVADDLRAENITTFGPGKSGANLEGSKADAIRFMEEFGIPHPPSEVFDDYSVAAQFVKSSPWWKEGGVVVKADGPAAGKGVSVCGKKDEAQEALEKIMNKKVFGNSGNRVVIQKKMEGYEASVMAIVSGDRYILLPASEDHKQIFDYDHGQNTGGMGVLAPHPLITEDLGKKIEETIIKRTLRGLKKRGIDYRGILYPGIMVTESGPVTLEYNARFGDPETEAVLPLIEGDLFPLLQSAAEGNLLFDGKYPTKAGYCVVVTLASGGYPDHYERAKKILGLETIADKDGVIIYHAGTEKRTDGIYTAGGRVLMVAGLGESIQNARHMAYGTIGENGVRFEKMRFRKDVVDVGDFCIAFTTEGLGTKNLIADIVSETPGLERGYYTAGWDTVAMIANDLAAVGARPVVISPHWGLGDSEWLANTQRYQALVDGWKDACVASGAAYGAGETSELKGVVYPHTVELSGAGYGVIRPKNRLTLGDKLQAGDHISGHGWRKLMRARGAFTYRLHTVPPPLEEFRLIQGTGDLTDEQMYAAYNMGVGFAFYVSIEQIALVQEIAQSLGYQSCDAGIVEDGPKQVIIEPKGIVFAQESLQIRQ